MGTVARVAWRLLYAPVARWIGALFARVVNALISCALFALALVLVPGACVVVVSSKPIVALVLVCIALITFQEYRYKVLQWGPRCPLLQLTHNMPASTCADFSKA
jgi:hypothetical protein